MTTVVRPAAEPWLAVVVQVAAARKVQRLAATWELLRRSLILSQPDVPTVASPRSPSRSPAPGGTDRASLASGIETMDRQRGPGHEDSFSQARPLGDLYE